MLEVGYEVRLVVGFQLALVEGTILGGVSVVSANGRGGQTVVLESFHAS